MMKLLTVSALLCAMVALTTAAGEGGSEGGKGLTQPGEHLAEKRYFWHPHFTWPHWRWWGWTSYGNRRYRYFPYHLTWAEAQRFCESKNARLASVRNHAEYRVIQRVIRRSTYYSVTAWTGGSDAQQNGYWFWNDGTPFRYANWCYGQPNNAGGREHCLVMNWTGGRCMNDVPCYNRYPFVCVRKRR